MSDRTLKLEEMIKQLAAKFIEIEADRTSLITVMRADISPDLKNSTIFISVLPDNQAEAALNFCKRKMTEFKQYAKKNMNLKIIPYFSVDLDGGQNNRNRIEELSHGM